MNGSTLRAALAQFFEPLVEASERPKRKGPGGEDPGTRTLTLGEIPSTGQGLEINLAGHSVLNDPDSHPGARLEVRFNSRGRSGWQPFTPSKVARSRNGQRFERFYLRKRASVPASLDLEEVYLIVDPGELEAHYTAQPRAPRLTDTGAAAIKLQAETAAGAEVDVVASDEGALAFSGWTGAAYVRAAISAAGRLLVNLIAGQDGITGGAGAVAANTPRVTHASDDPVAVSLGIVDDWDSNDRAKVSPIAAQDGVAADAGAPGATTQRTVEATPAAVAIDQVDVDDDPAVELAAADAGRAVVCIANMGPNIVFLGPTNAVTAATGFPLYPGGERPVGAGTTVYGICDAGETADVRVWEES